MEKKNKKERRLVKKHKSLPGHCGAALLHAVTYLGDKECVEYKSEYGSISCIVSTKDSHGRETTTKNTVEECYGILVVVNIILCRGQH